MFSIYGITISIAILSCIVVAEKIFRRRKDIWDIGLYCVAGGIIGARLYHVIDFFEYYAEKPANIFALWNGGLGIWGAVVGGVVGLYVYTAKNKKPFLETADVAATVLPLGQAIGRWGNFFNSEIEGHLTSLPWAINGRHPLFLYEFCLNLLLFFILLFLLKRRLPSGYLLASYLAGYGLVRFALEFLRNDTWNIAGLNVAQMVSILSIAASLYIFRKRRI